MEIEHKKSSGVLIYNDQKKLALQLRAAHDDSFPSHWDFSAGGGIEEGEDPKLSAEREIKEELGVDLEVEFVSHEHFAYQAWKPGVMRDAEIYIFKTQYSGPFHVNQNEVQNVEFFSTEEIEQMIAAGEKFHSEFLLWWEKQKT